MEFKKDKGITYKVVTASPAADGMAVAVGVLQQLQGLVEGDAATLKSAPEEITKLVRAMIGTNKKLINALNNMVGNIKEEDKNKPKSNLPQSTAKKEPKKEKRVLR